jgi:uncharacterized protein
MSRFTIKPAAIYVQNSNSQQQPIEGVSTSTVEFLGETQFGPNAPTLITSWLQFQNVFGCYFGEDKYLPYPVEGFFLNGGKRCFVCKATDNDYESALAKFEG